MMRVGRLGTLKSHVNYIFIQFCFFFLTFYLSYILIFIFLCLFLFFFFPCIECVEEVKTELRLEVRMVVNHLEEDSRIHLQSGHLRRLWMQDS